jgi:hypothetical protein
MPEGAHGINPGRAASRKIAGHQSQSDYQQHRECDRQRIGSLNAIEERIRAVPDVL